MLQRLQYSELQKHLNTTLDSAQLCRAVTLFDAKQATGQGPKLSARKRAALYVRIL